MYYKIIDNEKENWILLIHCILSNMNIFDNCIDDLSAKYNIILVDIPGHGKSSNYIDNVTIQDTACEICKILEEIKINKIDIWAISLGCLITKYIMELIPNKINKVIFEAPALGLSNDFYLILFYFFNKIKIILPKSMYLRLFIYFLSSGKKGKDIRTLMYKYLKKANKKVISKWLDEMLKEYKKKDYEFLNASQITKIYIIGEKDYVFRYAIIKNIYENEYNKVYIIENSSHVCHFEYPFNLIFK